MRTAMLAATVAVGMGLVIVLGGCAVERARAKQHDQELAAAMLGVPSESLLKNLRPEEREALERAGMTSPAASVDPAESSGLEEPGGDEEVAEGEEPFADKAGKVGVSVLQVGITLGMLAAPFFLF